MANSMGTTSQSSSVNHPLHSGSASSSANANGNSLFVSARKIEGPMGLLPDQIILGINEGGVHFIHPVTKEYIHSAEFTELKQYGYRKDAVFFEIQVAGVLRTFQFETKQVEEICVALQTHLEEISNRSSAPSGDVYEKRVHELSRALEESRKNYDQLQEELKSLKEALR